MRTFILAAAIALAFGSAAVAAPCKDVNGHFIKCPVVVAAKPVVVKEKVVPAGPVVVVKHLNCKVGVQCGNSCISKDKVCHKP